MPAGRPSDYDPSYCERMIEYGKRGKSISWMAAEIGCCKNTLDNWAKAHPEFADAYARAKLLSQQWWEDAGQDNLLTPGFSASVWSRSMAARFPDDWREVKGTELTGKDGAPVQIAAVEWTVVAPED